MLGTQPGNAPKARPSHLTTAEEVNKVSLKDSPSKTTKAESFRGRRPWTDTQQWSQNSSELFEERLWEVMSLGPGTETAGRNQNLTGLWATGQASWLACWHDNGNYILGCVSISGGNGCIVWRQKHGVRPFCCIGRFLYNIFCCVK